DAARGWDARLPHPGRGETAAVVRGALLERYWKLLAAKQPSAAQPSAAPVQPPILNRALPPLPADQRERVRQLARQTEQRPSAAAGAAVVPVQSRLCLLPLGRAPAGQPARRPADLRPAAAAWPLGGRVVPARALRAGRPAQRRRAGRPRSLVPVRPLPPREPPH